MMTTFESPAPECGALLIDKPAGVTSHDVVAAARRRFGGVKAGHTGTLDPFATGLLIVLLGRATRLQRFLLERPKTYHATARLGWRSDTGDPEGVIEHTGRAPGDPRIACGVQEQKVPAHSAVKVDGERLYKRARRGERFDPPTRTVNVMRADRITFDGERAEFEIECSSGTYVRSLISALGDAYCESLRRTAIGAITVDRADDEALVAPSRLLGHLPAADLSSDQAADLVHGRPIIYSPIALGGEASRHIRLMYGEALLGIGEISGETLTSTVILVDRIQSPPASSNSRSAGFPAADMAESHGRAERR